MSKKYIGVAGEGAGHGAGEGAGFSKVKNIKQKIEQPHQKNNILFYADKTMRSMPFISFFYKQFISKPTEQLKKIDKNSLNKLNPRNIKIILPSKEKNKIIEVKKNDF
jgi:hypothetical protein